MLDVKVDVSRVVPLVCKILIWHQLGELQLFAFGLDRFLNEQVVVTLWVASFSYIAWIRFFSACSEAGSIWIKKAANGLFALLRSMPLLISKACVLLTPVTKLILLPSNCLARLVNTFYSQVMSTSAYSPPKWCSSSMRRKSARKAGFNSWLRMTSLF